MDAEAPKPIATLRTERLLLRPTGLSDLDAYHALRSDPAVAAGLRRSVPRSIEDSEQGLRRVLALQESGGATSWSMEQHGGATLGFVGLVRTNVVHRQSEVFYEIRSEHWGKGLVTEALTLVIEHVFQTMDLHRLEGRVHPMNQRSMQVLTRCGFQKEGHLRESYFLEGVFHDSIVYGRLKSDGVR